jgi:hypothetical protein
MAGTPHGVHSITVAADASEAINAVRIFTALATALAYFQGLGICTLVSSYYGVGGAWGKNAFLVYRWGSVADGWYLLVQFNWGPVPAFGGLMNGSPAKILAAGGDSGLNLGIQVAIARNAAGARVSPWGGTINADGADSKSDPVWVLPAGGELYVWPASNASDGDHAARRENCAGVCFESSSETRLAHRMHIWADDDSLAIDLYNTTGTIVHKMLLITRMDILDGLPQPVDIAVFTNHNVTASVDYLGDTDLYGYTTGNQPKEGGVASTLKKEVSGMRALLRTYDFSSSFVPNKQFVPNVYPEVVILVYANDARYKGMVGRLDSFAMWIFGVASYSTLNTMERVAVGTATGVLKLSLPWDGATADPTAGGAPAGVQW